MKSISALAAIVPAVLAQATYYGCYTDIPSRALNSYFVWNNTNMTAAFCEAECLAHDPTYTLFGTQWGEEWYVFFFPPIISIFIVSPTSNQLL